MEAAVSWVVYLMSLSKKPPVKAVCDQSEWERLKVGRPGNTLVQAGIATEGEAEKVARGESPAPPKPWFARHS